MSELLTLEGRRLGYSNRTNFVRNSNSVSPKKRRVVKVKPLTCAALAGSAYRYDLEMAGIGSFVSRQAKKTTNAKKVVKVTPKPLALTDFEKLVFSVRMELGIHRPLAYYVIKNMLTNKHPSDLTPKQFELLKKLNLASINGKNLNVAKGDLLAGFFNNEMAGIGSFVSRQAKKANKTVKAVSKKIDKVTPKPLKKIVKVNTYLLTKPLEQTTKAIGLAARGQYASALKAQSPVSMIPQSWRNKAVSTTKKTAIGRALVKKASSVDNRVSKKINAQSKKVIVGAVTAAFGPAAGIAAQKFVPEGASPAKAAIIVDQIVQSPSVQAPTYENVAKAEEVVQQPETKSSSGIGILAALGAAAMFLI